MANEIKIRAWMAEGDKATVKAIMFHPMETGLRKDKSTGQVIPAHYITEAKVEHNGNNIMTCLWGPGISKNPFLSFSFKGAKAGDSLKISWVDNKGGNRSDEVKLS